MKFIVKPFAEIMIKSKPVRKRYLNFLQTNCNLALKKIDNSIKARFVRDRWEVNTFDELTPYQIKQVKTCLSRMPWIDIFLEVVEYELLEDIDFDNEDSKKEYFHDIYLKAEKAFLNKIENKTFVVRVKRSWTHNYRSTDVERYVWGWLLKHSNNSKVKLKNPDITINIEIKQDKLYLVEEKTRWIWWYPVWTQDKVLTLISWWFDSWVSTYSMMKRWCKVDYLFFNLWWSAHELWVKQVANYLWNNFWSGYRANFITVNFEEIIWELVTKTDHKFRWIILKRLFLMIADRIAQEKEYYAIIKWDSLWQVSSQTLKNMFVIDKASETLVLRPLISENKQDIINVSIDIWTYDFACNMPEYCWVISDKPATWAKLEKVLKEEKRFDFSLLEKAFESRKIEKINEVLDNVNEWNTEIDVSYIPWDKEIVIDIREDEKIKKSPLVLENIEILKIPFYEINNCFKDLDQEKTYLLYCDKWVLSNLHWLYLKEKWFHNLKIYRPIISDWSCKV